MTDKSKRTLALEACQRLFKEALPKFNWGASFLDANAIRLLNEVPIQVDEALGVDDLDFKEYEEHMRDHFGTIEQRAAALVRDAANEGTVLTIEQVPLKPLAMGHYETVVSVRLARVKS